MCLNSFIWRFAGIMRWVIYLCEFLFFLCNAGERARWVVFSEVPLYSWVLGEKYLFAILSCEMGLEKVWKFFCPKVLGTLHVELSCGLVGVDTSSMHTLDLCDQYRSLGVISNLSLPRSMLSRSVLQYLYRVKPIFLVRWELTILASNGINHTVNLPSWG
jgi:hypothetical protein